MKKIIKKYTWYIEDEVPDDTDLDELTDKIDNSSWCADNALDEIKKYIDEKNLNCSCSFFEFEYIFKDYL